MKKLLLSVLALSLCAGSFAQNRQPIKSINDLRPLPGSTTVPFHDLMISGDEQPVKKNFNSTAPVQPHSKVLGPYQTIGATTYDLQTNGSVIAARVYNLGNEIAAAWTFSTDLAGVYNDRGTAVVRSSDNGVSWGPSPTSRIETKRQGFGALDRLGSGEVVISHAAGAPLTLWSHATTSAPWDSSMIPFPAGMGYPLWTSMKVGGNNGTTIHMVTATAPVAQTPPGSLFNGMDGAMLYYRSPDGGLNWDIQAIQLPESDTSAASPYTNFRANSYAVDVRGDVVAVVSGTLGTDWSLWKSTDNGTNWTRTPVLDFPVSKIDLPVLGTDTNGDGLGDALGCSDADVSVVLDNNGVAHCFSGAMFVIADPGQALNYFPYTNGLLYWNENMGSNPPVVIAQADTTLGFALDVQATYGYTGLCSQPSAGVDAYNNIYVAYSNLNDGTTNGQTPEFSYRNVWAQASPDNGVTWNAPYSVLSDDFTEEVFPSVARDVDNPGCLHLIFQADPEPGFSVPPNGQQTTIGVSDIIYECVEPDADLGITVGITEAPASTFGISVSPNPASDLVMINYNLEKSATVKLTISNSLGQTAYRYETKMTKGKNSISVNLKNYSAGIYTVNTDIGEITYSAIFVVK
ncbi:MAG TPA: T9SS type A sorting domain-containing protein [Bacteroidia bacterium]|nr:T9SS type A sorting domain-containing protein [Bacteroidia bacterium]